MVVPKSDAHPARPCASPDGLSIDEIHNPKSRPERRSRPRDARFGVVRSPRPCSKCKRERFNITDAMLRRSDFLCESCVDIRSKAQYQRRKAKVDCKCGTPLTEAAIKKRVYTCVACRPHRTKPVEAPPEYVPSAVTLPRLSWLERPMVEI